MPNAKNTRKRSIVLWRAYVNMQYCMLAYVVVSAKTISNKLAVNCTFTADMDVSSIRIEGAQGVLSVIHTGVESDRA